MPDPATAGLLFGIAESWCVKRLKCFCEGGNGHTENSCEKEKSTIYHQQIDGTSRSVSKLFTKLNVQKSAAVHNHGVRL